MSHTSSSSSASKQPSSSSSSSSSSSKGGGGFVVTHEIVGPGWMKNQVLVSGEDFNADGADPAHTLDDGQIARLKRLGALRDAESKEVSDRDKAKDDAEKNGVEFEGYFVPEPVEEEVTA